MPNRITDEELKELLRSVPEPPVPPMAPLRLPPRPRAMPLPWRRSEIALVALAGAICLLAALWMALTGPGVFAADVVQILFAPGSAVGPGLATLFAALVGWLVVVLNAPRQSA